MDTFVMNQHPEELPGYREYEEELKRQSEEEDPNPSGRAIPDNPSGTTSVE